MTVKFLQLEPEWCVALLQAWASSDTPRLGLPRVNPMWAACRDAGGEDTGESDEAKALRAAIERLRCDEPTEHLALMTAFRPWVKQARPLEPDQDMNAYLRSAVHHLAEWVDEAVGE